MNRINRIRFGTIRSAARPISRPFHPCFRRGGPTVSGWAPSKVCVLTRLEARELTQRNRGCGVKACQTVADGRTPRPALSTLTATKLRAHFGPAALHAVRIVTPEQLRRATVPRRPPGPAPVERELPGEAPGSGGATTGAPAYAGRIVAGKTSKPYTASLPATLRYPTARTC